MKKGIRILGIDDIPFSHGDENSRLVGVVYRGTEFIEDIVSIEIDVDGDDASVKVVELYRECKNPGQIKAVLTDGISFAGFNIIDVEKVSAEIGKPVIAVTSNEPDRERFRKAMERSGNYDKSFEKLPSYTEVDREDGKIYLHSSGGMEETEAVIENSIIHGLTPEPIRVADMIGKVLEQTDSKEVQ